MSAGASVTEQLQVGPRSVELQQRGSGDAVLYLHGLVDLYSRPADDPWPPLLESLAATSRVLAPAHPGYAGSDGVESMDDVEDYVFHHLDLLDALGLDTVDVVGCSFGGWLAAELAVRHPERIRSLVLIGALGLHVPGTRPAQFFGAVAPRGLTNFQEAREVLFADPDSPAAHAALPDDMREAHQLRWFQGLAGAARIGWKAPQLSNRKLASHLHRIASPTLLVWGEQDALAPLDHARAWEAGIPDARLEVVPGGGHCVSLEQPDEVAGLVQAFLDQRA